MARLATFAALSPSLLLFLAAGCNGPDDGKPADDSGDSGTWVDTYEPPTDADGDGLSEEDGDCNDNDASIFLGQVESCDGIDNNCNNLVDEGYPDTDDDGTADCQDTEDCDGIDNNGDGTVDEGYPDSDGDGAADCIATEVCDGIDNDGDGDVDEGFDADGDGYTTCGTPADCDDGNAAVNPGADEADGNDVDDDCDGAIDSQTFAEGDLLITEVLYNPQAVIDPYGEWIELYNTTDRPIVANGLTIESDDGDSVTIMSSERLVIAPGDYFVLGVNGDPLLNGGVELDYVYSGASLTNEGDDLTLWGGGTLLDYLYWDGGASMPEASGASLMVDPGFYGSENADYWCAAIQTWGFDPSGDKGSPGALNEPCATWDHDGDGYTGLEGDCDDTDPTVYPGAFEGGSGSPPVDNDCDGDVETAPDARISYSTSGYACDTLTLDGTGSSDPEGSPLTYSWQLVGAPSGSAKTTADITTTTSAMPTFYPDVPGNYTFQLTVNDGGTNSTPVTTTIELNTRPTNNAPTPNAGADQTGSGTADCTPISYGAGGYDCDDCPSSVFTLSASASTDPDGDEMSYTWSVTSGSSYGSLSASSGESVNLTVSGVTASYGTAATQDIVVTVTATDCMGATATDDVTVQMQCTGY